MSKDNFQRDEPITIKLNNDDLLGTKVYVDALYDFISSCETPLTIGIQGDWGSGKTSLLNSISQCLGREGGDGGSTPFIILNTWQYAQFRSGEFLAPALIEALIEDMTEKFKLQGSKAKENAQKTIDTVLNIVSSISFAGSSININKARSDSNKDQDYQNISKVMKEFKSQFKQMVDAALRSHNISKDKDKKADRLVIFIDDLDRIDPVRSLELLEAMKNFLDVERCVFVLAVDYEVIQTGMRKKFGEEIQLRSGKSFFDKIIQLPFSMPQEIYDIGNYSLKILRSSGFFGDIKAKRAASLSAEFGHAICMQIKANRVIR